MTLRRLAGFVALLLFAMPAAAGPEDHFHGLRLLDVAGRVAFWASGDEARNAQVAGGQGVEQPVDLPPDGQFRLLVAVPPEDACLPRAAWLVCPVVRVVLREDAQHGHRAVRIEAYQPLRTPVSVMALFQQAAETFGVAMHTDMTADLVRGGAIVVWRQQWADGAGGSTATQFLTTQDAPSEPAFGLADPHHPATGIGLIRSDLDAEGGFAAVRRRLGMPPAPR